MNIAVRTKIKKKEIPTVQKISKIFSFWYEQKTDCDFPCVASEFQ